MGRTLRFLHEEGALVEITQKTFQGRHLLRPCGRLNALIVGCLAQAQEKTGAVLHGAVFLSNHFHLLASFKDVKQMADFMGRLKASLSKELTYLRGWPGSSWGHRYHAIPVSGEEAAQLGRLRYLLSNSCKEGLVSSPHEWPGVHCASSLVNGTPLQGVWIDRTSYHRAKKRNPSARLVDFERARTVKFEPLPCWSHLRPEVWRHEVEAVVEQIERQTEEHHRLAGTAPLGPQAVGEVDPWTLQEQSEQTSRPLVHAASKKVRSAMREAYSRFLEVYRTAAERLATGDRRARFPPNCFPPRLPFVPPLHSELGGLMSVRL